MAQPGLVRPAETGGKQLVGQRLVPATLREAASGALDLLTPSLPTGQPPRTPADAVVARGLGDRLGVGVGDTVTLVAAPWNGWMSTDGRVGQVIADQQKAFRISGIAASDELRAWSLDGWISDLVSADPAGVDQRYLVVGPEPVTWEQARRLNQGMVQVVSRHVLMHYPPSDQLYPVPVSERDLMMQLFGLLVAGVLGGTALLCLVTPAFAVAAEQNRRLVALAAATGATSRDLSRTISLQGVVLGGAGGVLGAGAGLAVGVVTLGFVQPDVDAWRHLPWWVLGAAVGLAVALGWIATFAPAYWVARQNPLDALRGRASTARKRQASRFLPAAVLLALGVSVAVVSLLLPMPDDVPAAGVPLLAVLLQGIALVAFVLGLLVRGAARLPLAARVAVMDAERHRNRVVPASAAVLVCVAGVSFGLVLGASLTSHEHDSVGQPTDPKRVALGVRVAVSDELDEAVVADGIAVLRERFPVTGSQPVYGVGAPRSDTWRNPHAPTAKPPTIPPPWSRGSRCAASCISRVMPPV